LVGAALVVVVDEFHWTAAAGVCSPPICTHRHRRSSTVHLLSEALSSQIVGIPFSWLMHIMMCSWKHVEQLPRRSGGGCHGIGSIGIVLAGGRERCIVDLAGKSETREKETTSVPSKLDLRISREQ